MKIKIILLSIIVLLVGGLIFQSIKLNNILDKYSVAVLNNKAYESLINLLNEQNKVFLFNIRLLEYINDSTINELNSIRKELKIKDNKLKQMGKIKEYIYFADSLIIYDTIFKERDFVLDTCFSNEWYDNCFHMEYPNKISSLTSINTDLNVFLYTTRETIEPPRKTWIGRLFLRKHDVYNVIVKENNPYVTIKENKFIIVKDN